MAWGAMMAGAIGLAAAGMANAQPAPATAIAPQSAKATARRLFAGVLRPGPAWKPGRPFAGQGLGSHFAYWRTLYRQGLVVSAGPLGADGGLVLLYARDQREADAIFRADPAIVAGIFAGDVRAYSPALISSAPLAVGKP